MTFQTFLQSDLQFWQEAYSVPIVIAMIICITEVFKGQSWKAPDVLSHVSEDCAVLVSTNEKSCLLFVYF